MAGVWQHTFDQNAIYNREYSFGNMVIVFEQEVIPWCRRSLAGLAVFSV